MPLFKKFAVCVSRVFAVSVAGLSLAGLALGCAGEVVGERDADISSTHPLLLIEQMSDPTSDHAVRSHVSVSFLRLADERDLGSAIDMVSPRVALPPVGTCTTVTAQREQLAPAVLSRVELAFAGDVGLHTRGTVTPLSARFFPNVADLVAGVTYTLRDKNDLTGFLDGTVTISTSGSAELEALRTTVPVPSMPAAVTVQGIDFTANSDPLPRHLPLVLAWQPGTDLDSIYVDLDFVPLNHRGDQAGSLTKVRCAFVDHGIATIPYEVVEAKDEVAITLHRIRDVVVGANSAGHGMAHFDLSVTGRAQFANHAAQSGAFTSMPADAPP